ncbi:uncharacterized protein MELLADRAFT_84177 [Melampsora larici-populina 98AG31]|uniref:Tet-like 2OG-Fe(II) oxygenase domain-containing protein n=1 Tax=Melampsora larici-populina (strain 98AG31 / pathotype 3-4-7) TaxID=747676 RepID=F4SBT4_MELLP|nr:uncharacterized protein MELLADRAFT_84177 [Melampsora larici-populina 98AG31]EGF97884.1 hypothetical protein MELLADRAFT_84177 [Melampsora larici-populina 98AG31]
MHRSSLDRSLEEPTKASCVEQSKINSRLAREHATKFVGDVDGYASAELEVHPPLNLVVHHLAGQMSTDMDTGWATRRRDKFPISGETNDTSLPGVTFISDLLKGIDVKRQTSFTDEDLPQPFRTPKSYAHVPHEYLAPDGFPKSEQWLNPACRFAILGKTEGTGRGRLVQRALNFYREQGYEGVPDPILQTERTSVKGKPRHAERARKRTDKREKDQSANSLNRQDKTFDRSFARFDDPILPFENYDRSMEIVFNCYTIVTHGRGQFYVDTILMATKLFNRLPLPKKSPPSVFTSEGPNEGSHPITSSLTEKNCPGTSALHQSGDSSPLSSLPGSDTEDMDISKSFNRSRPDISTQLAWACDALSKDEPTDYGISRPSSPLSSLAESFLAQMQICVPSSPLSSPPNSVSAYMEVSDDEIARPDDLRFMLSYPSPVSSPLSSLLSSPLSSLPASDTDDLDDMEVMEEPKQEATKITVQKRNGKPTTNGALINGKMYCFGQTPHTDNDKGKVHCLWYPIDSESGKIVTDVEGFALEGGWLIFPEFRFAFNFGAKSAVQISWDSKRTFHHTLPSKEKDDLNKDGKKVHYTRLGCSSQITQRMARASAKLGTNAQYNYKSNCERHLRDCDDILALDGRKWSK